MSRSMLASFLALILLSGCRSAAPEPAAAEPVAPTAPDTAALSDATTGSAATSATTETTAAGSGSDSATRTNLPQLQLTTFDGSGAPPNSALTPDRQLRLQRVAPAQNQLRLRDNMQNQIRQPVRQGIPSRATTTGATPVRQQPTLVELPTTTP